MSDTTMMQVINPRTGDVCATVPAYSAAKTLKAIQDARAAQAGWAARPVVERAKILMRIHDAVLHRRDELLDIIQLETGKNRTSALDEVMDVAINARYYARHAARLLRPRQVRGALPLLTRTTVVRDPRGVVGIIAPWNYPLTLTLSDALTGCTNPTISPLGGTNYPGSRNTAKCVPSITGHGCGGGGGDNRKRGLCHVHWIHRHGATISGTHWAATCWILWGTWW